METVNKHENDQSVHRFRCRPIANKKRVSFTLIVIFFFLSLHQLRNHPPYPFTSSGISSDKQVLVISETYENPKFPLQCNQGINQTQTCPKNYRIIGRTNPSHSSNISCPSYFRWIHEDLRHWKKTGVTRGMIERAREVADFGLVIVDGKAYVEEYKPSFQTRDVFTMWGILQLLRWYPGRLPDLELMFQTGDKPVIKSSDFQGPNACPPPLFRYCSDKASLDIVFPDWTFWGWGEVNIKPWKSLLEDIKEGNMKTEWKDRIPFAYWKGNTHVSYSRFELHFCNGTNEHDWNTHMYSQHWDEEAKQGFKNSNLKDQCTHRYKIYIDGYAWSVSQKYIMACDSMTLNVKSRYFDFFTRGMMPLQHYWPIGDENKCPSIKFSVEWGNNHTEKAQAIGKAASRFMQEELKMENVYDYMFHVLNAYAKLLKFKPMIPPGASELCSETMACSAYGNYKDYMLESLELSPSDTSPCTLPPPYDPLSLRRLLNRKSAAIRQVETWEDEYWIEQSKKQLIID